MSHAAAVFIGGGIGALLRWQLSLRCAASPPLFGAWLHERLAPIALGTLTVNLLGSFLLGLLAGGLSERLPESLQRGLTVGLLGGFTTFSSFSVEAIQLGRLRGLAVSSLQLSLHLCLGLAAAALGLALGARLAGRAL